MPASIYDKTLKQHHKIEQRANQLAADMAEVLQAAHTDIIAKMAELEAQMLRGKFAEETASRRKALLHAQREEIERILALVYADMQAPLKEAGQDVMTYTASATSAMLAPVLGISVSEPKLDKAVLEAWFTMSNVEGLLVNEWLSKLEKSAADRIVSAGRRAMIEAMPIGQAARFMRKNGIDGSVPALEGLARTWCQSAAHFAKEALIETQFGDFTTGWRYLATLDGRTCPVCGADDLKIYPRGADKPLLPRHWRCRCVYIPRCKFSDIMDNAITLIDDRPAVQHKSRIVHHRDGSTSTKFSVDKVDFVPQNMTYETWMKKQLQDDPAFVRSVLGKTRYELFKSGRITLRQMTANGKIKRLADLL